MRCEVRLQVDSARVCEVFFSVFLLSFLFSGPGRLRDTTFLVVSDPLRGPAGLYGALPGFRGAPRIIISSIRLLTGVRLSRYRREKEKERDREGYITNTAASLESRVKPRDCVSDLHGFIEHVQLRHPACCARCRFLLRFCSRRSALSLSGMAFNSWSSTCSDASRYRARTL